MSRPTKRTSLQALKRGRLLQLVEQYEVEVSARAKVAEIVDALVAARSVRFEDVLGSLSRNELKAICVAHELDKSGKAKAPIIARIIGKEPESKDAMASSSQSAKRKSKKKTTKAKKSNNGNGAILGFEAELFGMADQLWTNSGLRPSEYAIPVLALVFLKYADHKFTQTQKALQAALESKRRRRSQQLTIDDYLAHGVLYVPEEARFQTLLELPEGSDLGKAVNDAMKAIEHTNPELKDVLPKTFAKFERTTLASLLKIFGNIPSESSGDTFGRIYEYFLGKFAPRTLQKGGEYFTPESVVKLIVEIVEPFHGRILDPACGSGGMFIQSARFVQEQHKKNPAKEISIYGIEKISQTLRLAKMSLAVHGLSGDIREANTYYEDPHDCVGKFDFVMANPPFNAKAVDKERIKDDRLRFAFGMPTPDNANYLWIQLFHSAMNERGRAGFVMANSASDAGSEALIREALIREGVVDVIVSLSNNLFYTVTLPATLWFLDKSKRGSERGNRVLFIDARQIYRQVDRAHRELTPSHIEHIANIARLYRGESPQHRYSSSAELVHEFPSGVFRDVPGLCCAVTVEEIAEHDWSLNPGRYVGVKEREKTSEGSFEKQLAGLDQELRTLNRHAEELQARINRSLEHLIGGGHEDA